MSGTTKESISHPNVILHIDIDYFYAQVEEVMNPELKTKPFGIQQGINIVTCNYIAREYGIKKWRPLQECLEKCPDLVLVNGEDLSNYKVYSKKMTELLHTLVGPSERMGLDEHFLDITKQVEDEISKMTDDELKNLRFSGPFNPNEETFSECKCGCEQRLMVGSQMAKKIRAKILEDLKLTCSVGIAHNKLLAKLVGQVNKPNNQTTLAPTSAEIFMADLKDLRSITGIGGRTASRIEELGITNIEELQKCPLETLQKAFTHDTAMRLKEMATGCDTNEVKPSGKPKTVGLEDSCKPFTARGDAEEMYRDLLPQLVHQIQDDLRLPLSIRVTVRHWDLVKKASFKETKQCNLAPSCFKFIEDKLHLAEGADDKIIKNVMNLFDAIVKGKQKYFINLVGLCFCKFQEQKRGAGSIAQFLKRKDEDESSSRADVDLMNLNTSGSSESFVEENFVEELLEPPAKRLKTDDPSPPKPEPSNTKMREQNNEIDPSVWSALPPDIQLELMKTWQQAQKQEEISNSFLRNSSKSTVKTTIKATSHKTSAIKKKIQVQKPAVKTRL